MTIDQFGKALVASGLMTADDVKATWNAAAPESRPKDGAGFGKLLVDKSLLTPFQAAELLAGRGARLMMGDYTIVAQIGAGGMGQVYKAQHRRMKRTVALKVMSNAAMQDEAAVKRFQREVHAAARLEHPNIVTAYDSGEAGSVKYLVMQFVDGGDLSDLVKKNGRLGIEQAVVYVIQAARGLAFAHGEGVIHRDIKPANLLLDKKGVVKILDMGLARFEDGGDGLTATEQVMGTVDYMSPEQAANTKGCDGRADIYSLGCTLWYLLTAKKVYEADTLIARLMKHRDGELPSLVKERDDAPWPLEQALHKMIAKRTDDRYQSMNDVIAALGPYGGDTPSSGGSFSGMGSGIGHNADLASFMQSMGPGGAKPSAATTQVKSATSTNVDATAQFSAPEVGTDPKSSALQTGAQAVKSGSPSALSSASPSKLRAPVKKANRNNKPPVKLIAAGAAGFLFLLFGVWIFIRDKDGNEVARVQMPEGGSVTVKQQPAATGGPAPVAAATRPAVSFFLPSGTPASPPGTTTPPFVAPPPAVPSSNGVVYLDDLPEKSYFGHGRLKKPGRDPSDAESLSKGFPGVSPVHTLLVHVKEADLEKLTDAKSSHKYTGRLVYDLAGNYASFQSGIRARSERQLVAEVWGDGKRLWESIGFVRREPAGTTADVDVRGVREMTLLFWSDASSNHSAEVLLIEPRLTPVRAVALGNAPPPAVFPFDAATAAQHQEAWARYLGVPVEFTNTVGMKFRLIPPGEFQMGLGPEFTDEELLRLNSGKDDLKLRGLHMARPAHPVRITRPFYMEVEEVKSGRYRDVVGQLRPEMTPEPDKPLASHVAWPDAIAFCNKLSEREGKRPAYRIEGAQITPLDDADGYRLPTEAQWEYACRAGTNTLWYFGSDGGADFNQFRKRCAVPNPFGLTGLYGGANEWCWDATNGNPYRAVSMGRRDDPREDVGTSRIKRGGSGNDDSGGNRGAINSFVRIRTSGGPYGPDTSRYAGFGRVVLPITAITPPLSDASNASGRSPGAATTVAAPQRPLASTKTDLLKNLDAVANAVDGKFALDANGLRVTDGAQQARVVLPVDPMPAEYDLHIAVGRSAPGGKAFVIGVPWQGSQGCVVIDGFSNPPLSGLELVDGQTPKVNGTENPGEKITFGPRNHNLIVRVRNEGIAAECDSKPLFDWKGKPSQLSTHAMWMVPRKDLPFLGFQGPYVVHSVELLPFDAQPIVPAASTAKLFIHDPAFPQWLKDVQAMSAAKQIEAVSKKLVELHPGFDGKLTDIRGFSPPTIEGGVVTQLKFNGPDVTDISPLRALTGLKALSFGGSGSPKGKLTDLSPLVGMQVTDLTLSGMGYTIADVTLLKDLRLEKLTCRDLRTLADLAPLKGMPLKHLDLLGTAVADVAPLQGMPLEVLVLPKQIKDLAVLQGMPLTRLECTESKISDLSPLRGMPLETIWCKETSVADLSPLYECKSLKELNVEKTKVSPAVVAALQNALPNCKVTWDDPAKATPNVGTK